MHTTDTRPPLLLSRVDVERIESLLEHTHDLDTSALQAELARADVVEAAQVPGDVVAMNSTVRLHEDPSGDERELTLVYPHDLGDGHGKVSILAPVGSALIGLRVGDAIEWPVPGGLAVRLRVLSIRHQPESAGVPHP